MRAFVAIAAVAAGLAPLGAHAQPSPAPNEAEARELFAQGRALAEAERWGEALEFFRRSRDRFERPATVFNVAVCLFTLGRHVEAVATFETFSEMADPVRDAEQIREAEAMSRQSREAIATLSLQLSPATADLAVDGRSVPGTGADRQVALDPGEHVIRLTAPRHRARSLRVSVLPGQRLENRIALAALATRPPAAEGGIFTSPVFWTLAAIVVVGAGVGLAVLLYDPGVQDPIPGTLGVRMTLTGP